MKPLVLLLPVNLDLIARKIQCAIQDGCRTAIDLVHARSLVEHPVRLPKNRIPLNAPDVGADNVAVTCPLIVTGV